jgi:ABC-2 type transport system ATP-binding protein
MADDARSLMTALEVTALTKWYGSIKGIEDVSFALERGEVFGYLGPNGSGKTTTLRCIAGLIQPTRGEVILLGERVRAGRATQHERLGYLPGEFRLWPRFRVRQSLGVLAALGQLDGVQARQEKLAARLGLDLDRPFGTLSKGNRQKVAVIGTFQHQPELLILDEPTSGLDPLMRQVVLDLIREAAAGGATVLLSSHDLNEVSAVCGRAGILREGRLVEVGPISRIVQQGERRLQVWFVDAALKPPVPVERLTGVRMIEQQPGMVHLAYHGTCGAALEWIAQFPVDHIATPETSLEEAFFQYYQTPTDAPGLVRPGVVSQTSAP